MNIRVEEIKKEAKIIRRKHAREKEKIMDKWKGIQAVCTHPDLGIRFMFICADCEYYGGPVYPDELGHRDYIEYEENSEKTRQWRRKLKAKYTQTEIVKLTKEVKQQLQVIQEREDFEVDILTAEWNDIKSRCSHNNMRDDICEDCGKFPDGPLF